MTAYCLDAPSDRDKGTVLSILQMKILKFREVACLV